MYDGIVVQGAARDVYRVYANFDDPDDHLIGSPNTHNGGMTITTGNGTLFFNPGGTQGNLAPFDALEGDEEFGTFVTVGVPFGSMAPRTLDMTILYQGFPNFIAGSSMISNNIGWFTPGPVPQGQACYLDDGDNRRRVMMMQLAVNDGVVPKVTCSVHVNEGRPFSVVYYLQTAVLIPSNSCGSDVWPECRDGAVNIDDLFGVLGAWGTADVQFDISPTGAPDGVVDVNDLFQVLMNWGDCP